VIAIGLGGNLGDRERLVARFRSVRAALAAVRSASLYCSAPVGPDQPDFLNTAVLIDDDGGEPLALLARLHALEAAHGRNRADEVRWGPRPLDLDVLVWERAAVALPELAVPHPRLGERRFALLPLAELLGEPWRSLASAPALRDQRVALVASSW
jgi:2-amino-4-hydroxy-6-hydroxymethyldihydropteridine diphosphokinase